MLHMMIAHLMPLLVCFIVWQLGLSDMMLNTGVRFWLSKVLHQLTLRLGSNPFLLLVLLSSSAAINFGVVVIFLSRWHHMRWNWSTFLLPRPHNCLRSWKLMHLLLGEHLLEIVVCMELLVTLVADCLWGHADFCISRRCLLLFELLLLDMSSLIIQSMLRLHLWYQCCLAMEMMRQ